MGLIRPASQGCSRRLPATGKHVFPPSQSVGWGLWGVFTNLSLAPGSVYRPSSAASLEPWSIQDRAGLRMASWRGGESKCGMSHGRPLSCRTEGKMTPPPSPYVSFQVATCCAHMSASSWPLVAGLLRNLQANCHSELKPEQSPTNQSRQPVFRH